MFPKPLPRSLDKRQAKREDRKFDRRVKAFIRVRDGHQCRCCGRKELTDVHERKTRGAGGKVSRDNSLVLCRVCHDLAGMYRIVIEGQTCDGPLLFTMARRIADVVFPRGDVPKHVHVLKEGL